MSQKTPANDSLGDVISRCVQSPQFQNFPPLTQKSKALLAKFYNILIGPYRTTLGQDTSQWERKIRPPVIISFHPKLSLLNNNVQEALMAVEIAKATDQVPVWIPYVYDTATHSAEEGGKIRAPTYCYIEDTFIPMRAFSQIHGNIIKTEKPPSKKEVQDFYQALELHITNKLGTLQGHLNQYNFGHALFNFKQKVMQVNRKKVKGRIDTLKQATLNALQGGTSLGEALGQISLAFLHELGIPMNLGIIERVMPELVIDILNAIIARKAVKDDPSMLEGLFVYYNIKDKTRTPVQFTGDKFIAIDDNSNRLFDGDIQALAEAVQKSQILPTGPALILLFVALGCQITLGGAHTQEYYPDYLSNAKKLLAETGFNITMRVFGYGDLRLIDTRNMSDILAVSRILDKVGSRTIVQKQSITIPRDIVDHLHFIAGKESIPQEYYGLMPELDSVKDPCEPAIIKEENRSREILSWNKFSGEDLQKQAPELKKYFRQFDPATAHPERLKIAMETLANDTEMRVSSLKENIQQEQHFLGGKIPLSKEMAHEDQEAGCSADLGEGSTSESDKSATKEIFGGIYIRSKRVPTLLELVLYKTPIDRQIQLLIELEPVPSPFYFGLLRSKPNKPSDTPNNMNLRINQSHRFTEYSDAFKFFIPNPLLPDFFQ